LGNNQIKYSSINSILNTSDINYLKTIRILKRVYKSSVISGEDPDVAVGLVESSQWFMDNLNVSASGLSKPGFKAILSSYHETTAHEIGHRYGLCDERDSDIWDSQDKFLIFSGKCPNGDLDDDGDLDDECIPYGCPASSLKLLSGEEDNETLKNLMGKPNNLRWIAKDSYSHLLEEFSTTSKSRSGPESSRILISGYYDNSTGDVTFDTFYKLEEGYVDDQDSFSGGDYAIEIFDNLGAPLTNISFNLSFYLVYDDGNMTPINVTPFTFVLPSDVNLSRITFSNSTDTIGEVNKTPNTPTLQITSNLSGQIYTGETINLTWISTDADSDPTVYAILFSDDNGGNYTTLEIDYNETSLTLNALDLPYCNECKFKILATDGINTNTSASGTFSIIPEVIQNFSMLNSSNKIGIFEFIILDSYLTPSYFPFNFNFGDTNGFTNSLTYELNDSEDLFVIIEHNYTPGGTYNVTANVTVGYANDIRTLEATIS
ncbi:MAG: hypothetical protein KKB31_04735, partial [Nanoarchaeota archaeon]|nr:hypothetical protein [Nanoarchaeota archaeon]